MFNTRINKKEGILRKVAGDAGDGQQDAQNFGWIQGQMPKYALKKLNLLKPVKINVYDWRIKGKSKKADARLNKSDIANDRGE